MAPCYPCTTMSGDVFGWRAHAFCSHTQNFAAKALTTICLYPQVVTTPNSLQSLMVPQTSARSGASQCKPAQRSYSLFRTLPASQSRQQSSVEAAKVLEQQRKAQTCAAPCVTCSQVDGLPVFGVAIPTVAGLRQVMDAVRPGTIQTQHNCSKQAQQGSSLLLRSLCPLPALHSAVLGLLLRLAACTKLYWQNLREEPLIFINGNPFVVREADQPFSNLEYTGTQQHRTPALYAQ